LLLQDSCRLFFKTWRDEYRERINAQHLLRNLSEPDLRGKLEQFGVGIDTAADQLLIMAVVSISNLGAQSIADSFAASIRFPNGQHYDLELWVVRGIITLMGLRITMDDMIFQKAIAAPVQNGALVRGYLLAKPKPQDKD
jgi:hypothetical protein